MKITFEKYKEKSCESPREYTPCSRDGQTELYCVRNDSSDLSSYKDSIRAPIKANYRRQLETKDKIKSTQCFFRVSFFPPYSFFSLQNQFHFSSNSFHLQIILLSTVRLSLKRHCQSTSGNLQLQPLVFEGCRLVNINETPKYQNRYIYADVAQSKCLRI